MSDKPEGADSSATGSAGERQERFEAARKLLGKSGFLFETKVEELIRNSAGRHPWRVLRSQVPWSDLDSGRGGHIDLVCNVKAELFTGVRLVIEWNSHGSLDTW